MKKNLVWIEWLDSCHTEGWHTEGQYVDHPLHVISIGFLHMESDDAVTLIMTRDENGRWSNSITIPKSTIIKRRKVPLPKGL